VLNRRSGVAVFVLFALTSAARSQPAQDTAATQDVPLTTRSAEARQLFLDGRHYRENWRLAEALKAWRAAAKKDPDFAMAQLYVSLYTPNPKEQAKTRASAKRLLTRATLGEQLTIKWLGDAQEGNFLPAIASMNDLLEMYPRDKWLLFQAGRWLILQRRWDKGQVLLERAQAIDPDYTAALNQLGYLYASRGPQFEKSFKTFAHYAQIRPHEPNPQDSWAEVLRMAGEYNQALEHYRKALEIDPRFSASQLGIADTYALMGDQARARVEYDKAIQSTSNQRDRLVYGQQIALTYVREGKYEMADRSYLNVASQAHSLGLSDVEADCHIAMAMYQPDFDKAMANLDSAEAILHGGTSAAREQVDRGLARGLYIRAWRAAKAGKTEILAAAADALSQLDKRSGNNLIRQSSHAAAGMLALAQGRYGDAVSQLEEEDLSTHLISMEQMALAYEKSGDLAAANRMRGELKRANLPGIEQVLVVMPLRNGAAGTSSQSR
jgi:tetratricopeptide (TPR) repeat protein